MLLLASLPTAKQALAQRLPQRDQVSSIRGDGVPYGNHGAGQVTGQGVLMERNPARLNLGDAGCFGSARWRNFAGTEQNSLTGGHLQPCSVVNRSHI
jgi:hypothetical protein